jgi:serine/threonine protein kinase
MTGRTISHYTILEKLGEGGMGVVYKARDTHLDRFAAIKVLRPDAMANAERKRRFVQEAKSASALNHPNIIHVYDIDTCDGVDYIAMEFVPGKTLDQLIGRRGLKLSETLNYGIQISAALAKAHAAGIVHRDLKPSNVIVTSDGLVKLLDFGLAKLTETSPTSEEASTATLKAQTEEGIVLGTAAYMSPEQASGSAVDARSDIFSFGAVLYEMVTGRRAFQAETRMATLSAILNKEPQPASTINEDTPPEMEKLIARCLRKDPERRIQNMADVKLALEDLKEESESGRLLAAPQPRRSRMLPWILGGAALVAAAASVASWVLLRPRTAPPPVLTQLTTDAGLTLDPALSPDGKLLAYASDRAGEGNLDIWVKQVGGGEPIRLTQDPAEDREPSFSPDGTSIVFSSARESGGIYVVSALGGAARKIAAGGQRPRFSPDGSQIAYWTGVIGGGAGFSSRGFNRMFVVAASGGAPRQVRGDFVGAAYPEWTPDGLHLLFLGNRDTDLPAAESIDWWVTPLDGGPAIATGVLQETRKVGFTGPFTVYPWALMVGVWHPDGDSVIFGARQGDSRNLWRIRMTPQSWKVAGVPERLTSSSAIEEGPSVARGAGNAVRLAFASLSENSDLWSLPIDTNSVKTTGEPQRLTSDTAPDFHPSLSHDGSRLVFVSGRTGGQEIWIRDLKTGEERALTASRADKYSPNFSPDMAQVSFSIHKDNKWDIYLVPSSGGAAELVCPDCGQATGWSPDGRYLTGNTLDGRLTLIEVATRRKVDLIVIRDRWFCCGKFSPDGRWISFLELGSGRRREIVAPFQGETPPPESSWLTHTAGLRLWLPDGAFLYGTSFLDGFECIWAQRLDPATKRPAGAPIPVFHAHGRRQLQNGITVGRDRIMFSQVERAANVWMAEFRR